MKFTEKELIDFELEIAASFNNKEIRAPIHLQDNNAGQLIEIFKHVKKDDWACGTWRFHMESLLKGVPKDELKKAILDGRSISLCFKKQKVIASAIVGGIIPISLGIALDIKRKGGKEKVWCFIGEMSATTGIFHEAITYAENWELPIIFVVSDNGKSVCTDTRAVWNIGYPHAEQFSFEPVNCPNDFTDKQIWKRPHRWYYKYNLNWPHAGSGVRINFVINMLICGLFFIQQSLF
jgi:hypothetical protein